MPSSQPTVDKISCDAEIEPSVGCEEGTNDRLNEAPRKMFWYDEFLGLYFCEGIGVINPGQFTRDGQPAPTPSR